MSSHTHQAKDNARNALDTQENQLRKVAILVSSVDSTAARQLLMQLSAEDALRVRQLSASLGEVSEAERREIIQEFRHFTN